MCVKTPVAIGFTQILCNSLNMESQIQRGSTQICCFLYYHLSPPCSNLCFVIFQDAEDYAAALDAVPEKQRGPLHGIPVSIKVKCLHIHTLQLKTYPIFSRSATMWQVRLALQVAPTLAEPR